MEATFSHPSNSSETPVPVSQPAIVAQSWTISMGCVSACLSIIGAIFIFVSYAKVPETRNFTRKLLVYLTVADLLTAIGYLIGLIRYAATEKQKIYSSSNDDGLCVVQSFLVIYTNLSSFLWTIVIAFHIFISYTCQTDITSRLTLHILYHIICWGIPVVVPTAAAISGVLGHDNTITPTPWCFLRGDLEHKKYFYWSLGIIVVWEFLAYLICSFLYICLKFLMCRRARRIRIDVLAVGLRPEDRNYVCVWLILYLLKVWGTARDYFVIFSGPTLTKEDQNVLFVLLNCQCIFDCGQAFANFILFCVCDGTVRSRLTRSCRRQENEPLIAPE